MRPSWFDLPRPEQGGAPISDPAAAWRLRVAWELCTLVLPGRLPRMPGTWGSLLAVLLVPWCFAPLGFWARLFALLVIFVLGGLAASLVERALGRKDPGQVVVDELLGQWLTFLPFAVLGFWDLVWGLLLFRVFDIAKPWPVRAAETWLPSGWGVMIDDVLAGLYALLGLGLIRWLAG